MRFAFDRCLPAKREIRFVLNGSDNLTGKQIFSLKEEYGAVLFGTAPYSF